MASDISETEATPTSGKFQPGRSGNPNGRPRKTAKSHASAVRKAMEAKVEVTENGRRKRMTKSAVAATQLANKVAGGDLRAHKMVLDIERAHSGEEGEESGVRNHSETDLKIVKRMEARIRSFTPEES